MDPAHSTRPTSPDIVHRMLQQLRLQHRSNPESPRQLKQEPSSTSAATSHPAPTPTKSIDDELKKELETLSMENRIVKADLLAKDDELTQSQKEYRELKIKFEALKVEAQEHKERLILYDEILESTENKNARLKKENQDLVSQLGLLYDERQGQLERATKKVERMRQKNDRFLALLAALCYNENRRTLLRSTFLSMNVLVGLDEDHMEELLHFINFDDNVASSIVSTIS